MAFEASGLEGCVALVTGVAGEIGSALGEALLQAGASVAGISRRRNSRQPGMAGRHEPKDRFLPIRADIRIEKDVRRAVATALDCFGKIDILINNAGARGPTAPVTGISLKAWQEVLDTNLTGPFLLCRECLKPMMRQRQGCIINISSVAAHWAYPLRSPYAASKAGLINLTLTLAQEAGAANIRVNAICPGPVAGEAIKGVLNTRAKALGISTAEMERRFMRPSALGRMVSTADINRMVLFLCSDAALNITGQVIDVSAGYSLYLGV